MEMWLEGAYEEEETKSLGHEEKNKWQLFNI